MVSLLEISGFFKSKYSVYVLFLHFSFYIAFSLPADWYEVFLHIQSLTVAFFLPLWSGYLSHFPEYYCGQVFTEYSSKVLSYCFFLSSSFVQMLSVTRQSKSAGLILLLVRCGVSRLYILLADPVVFQDTSASLCMLEYTSYKVQF